MSDQREAVLRDAIRHVDSTVAPITLEEVVAQPTVVVLEALPELTSVDKVTAPAASVAQQGPRSSWLIGIAAAAVILLGVLFDGPDDGRIDTIDPTESTLPEPTVELTTPPTQVEVDDSSIEPAQQFIRAFAEFDSDVLGSLIAPEADVRLSPWGGAAALDQQLDSWESSRSRVKLIGCEPLPGDGFSSCRIEIDDIVTRVQGLVPVTVAVTIGVSDGLVHTAVPDWNDYLEWVDEPWGTYGQWVRANRQVEFEVLYPTGDIRPPDVTDPEVRAVFAQVLADYERVERRGQLTESQP
jgi:hypothetical protein